MVTVYLLLHNIHMKYWSHILLHLQKFACSRGSTDTQTNAVLDKLILINQVHTHTKLILINQVHTHTASRPSLKEILACYDQADKMAWYMDFVDLRLPSPSIVHTGHINPSIFSSVSQIIFWGFTKKVTIFQWALSVMTSKNKNGRCSVGTFLKFVWVTMGRKILNDNISAKEEDRTLTHRYG